jgi:preprotein translocase subunit SecB
MDGAAHPRGPEAKLPVATVDFAAVARVSRYAELKDIRVVDVYAKCDPKYMAPLEPEFSHECTVVGNEKGALDISCQYRFTGNSAQTKIVSIEIKYLLTYAISSPEPLPEADITQFANGNGTLHSWPFVREFLYSLTSRMGIPPFKLGVMHFVPTQQAPSSDKAEPVQTAANS